MAGGHMKYRHLGVKSSHRQALLRNLVTSLIEHESITTTYAKAKEAQKFAEKLISLGKRNTEAARNRVKGILFRPELLMPKLFGPLRTRYINRPGGYTRVLHIEPSKEDTSPSAILELVDGPRDMRFMMTAKTLANERAAGINTRDKTAENVAKVTRYRPDGQGELERAVKMIESRKEITAGLSEEIQKDVENRRKMGDIKGKVYPPYDMERRGMTPPRTGTGRWGMSRELKPKRKEWLFRGQKPMAKLD